LPVFNDLNQYLSTMHFNGQSAVKPEGSRATGLAYCRAYHLSYRKGRRQVATVIPGNYGPVVADLQQSLYGSPGAVWGWAEPQFEEAAFGEVGVGEIALVVGFSVEGGFLDVAVRL
jgi:hypothetical protein